MTPNIKRFASERWYDRSGNPQNFIPKKDGSGDRPTTLTDARKFGWLPSVTTILNVVHKPNLQDWLIMQAVRAVMETPRRKDENDDAFLERVLVTERIQDLESRTASSRGTEIHKSIELAIQSQPFEDKWRPYVEAVFPVLENLGKIVFSERIVVGDGYAGKCDIGLEEDRHLMILDFKTTGSVPTKEAYLDHRLQVSGYAKAIGNTGDKRILTAILYISTKDIGQTKLFIHDDWEQTFENGFLPILKYWQFANNYKS